MLCSTVGASVTAGVEDEILGADGVGALELAAEGVDGFGADHGV